MKTTLKKLNLQLFGYPENTEVVVLEPINPEIYNMKTVQTLDGHYLASI